jgi:hypothetical protein
MTKYFCNSCNYQFEPKAGKVPRICPYCSKPGTVEKVKTTQDWLNETESSDEE